MELFDAHARLCVMLYEFNPDEFTRKAREIIRRSLSLAGSLGHTYVGSEHILWAILDEGASTACLMLQRNGLSAQQVKAKIEKDIGMGTACRLSFEDFTPTAGKILSSAVTLSKSYNNKLAGSEHILASLLREKGSCAVSIIRSLGVSPEKLCGECSAGCENEEAVRKPCGVSKLEKYAKEITRHDVCARFDPVIARDREIERVIEILCRRTKNNPCLVGEAGVGKTAIVEGIARRLCENTVPKGLSDKRIFSLDLTALLSGAKYRGDFEERLKQCVDEAVASGCIILFIDEIHSIMGTGAAEGAIDAASIIKPQLARGELQIIGATTFDEYRKYIEKDAALERRFQPVMVEEPSPDTTIEILEGLLPKYESFHKVEISREAVRTAVELSGRYVCDRYFPDKAIDLIDEACAKVRIREREAQDNGRAVSKAFSDYVAGNITKQEYLEALTMQVAREKMKPLITAPDVAQVVSAQTGIPVNTLSEAESKRLMRLEQTLSSEVIGQHKAVSVVSAAIRRSRSGLRSPDRPIGSFVFSGPSGVGKTKLAKVLARELFGNEQSLIRFDMSEYTEKHTISRLIGSPPGYVGHDEGGQLTEKVRRKPYSIVLFDEIEKAHRDIYGILLQILEDGFVTDAKGRRVSFVNTVIIMTTNVGVEELLSKKQVGFSKKTGGLTEKALSDKLREIFSPELRSRIDEQVVFAPLSKESLCEIARGMLSELSERALRKGINLVFDSSVVERLSEKSDSSESGARAIRHRIVAELEGLVSDYMIENPSDDSLLVTTDSKGFLLCSEHQKQNAGSETLGAS